MTNQKNFLLSAIGVTVLLLAGCVTEPQLDNAVDPHFDKLSSQLNQSLANQALASEQMKAQQQLLDRQQQDLSLLNENLRKALKAPEASKCPEPVACPAVQEVSGKMTVGGLEQVWFPDLGLALTARIDTGRATASLDAREIEEFERDGKRWVRFSITNPETSEPETLERRLVRTIGIQQAGAAKSQRRPVVKMSIKIGQVDQTAEFGLSDRSHTGYQVMIGRSILKDVMVVDVSKQNIVPYTLPDASPDDAGAAE